MSVKSRVMLSVAVVCLIGFTSIFAYQVNHTQQALQNQQQIELDNTIYMLKLALDSALEASDHQQVEALVYAAFDGSFYQRASLDYLDNTSPVTFIYPNSYAPVPALFKAVIEVEPIQQQASLSSGWSQQVQLLVETDIKFTYATLWQNVKGSALNLSGTFLGVYALILICLHLCVHRPLKKLTTKMQQVVSHRSKQPIVLPSPKEFRRLAVVFNDMNKQLDSHLKLQAEEAERFRQRAYQDSTTTLANREFLLIKLNSWLRSDDEGGVMLLSLEYLDDLYQARKFTQADTIAKQLAMRLQEYFRDEFTIGRLKSAEFAFICPNFSSGELKMIAQKILDVAQDLQPDPMGVMPLQAAVGIVMKGDRREVSELLTAADNAALKARAASPDPIHILDDASNALVYGRQQWLAIIEQAIANDEVGYTVQTAVGKDYQPLYKEVYSWISHDDEMLSAGTFLPAIEKLGKGTAFDRCIITTLFTRLSQQTPVVPYAINLTISSVIDSAFVRWLETMMVKYRAQRQWMIFEIPEVAFIKHLEHAEELCEVIHRHQFAFGIDNFGHNFSAMSYLQQLAPDYVKLDSVYTSSLDQTTQADALHTLTQTATSLNIKVIATRVETKQQVESLIAYGIDGFQGYIVAELNKEEVAHD